MTITRPLLIHCSLKLKKIRDYSPLYAMLDKLSSCRIICVQDDCFIIQSEKTAALIKELLKDTLSPIDSVLIVELPFGANFTHHGLDHDDIGSMTSLLNAQAVAV